VNIHEVNRLKILLRYKRTSLWSEKLITLEAADEILTEANGADARMTTWQKRSRQWEIMANDAKLLRLLTLT
jgi:hypothetical protein